MPAWAQLGKHDKHDRVTAITTNETIRRHLGEPCLNRQFFVVCVLSATEHSDYASYRSHWTTSGDRTILCTGRYSSYTRVAFHDRYLFLTGLDWYGDSCLGKVSLC